jgi:hypothetical protein
MPRKQSVRLTIIFLLVAAISYSTFAFAETIVFKWGQKIEEKIIERTDEYIKIDFQGTPLIYRLDDIESIDGVRPASSSKRADIKPSYEDNVSKKDLELQGPLTASTESTLNSSYSNFDVFRIRIPREWVISQKIDGNVTRILVSKNPHAIPLHGVMILYTPVGFAASEKIYEERFIKKFEEQSKKFLGKYGDAITNTRISKIRFNDIPALQFDADIPRPDLRASQILFNKDGFNFSIIIVIPISQYERYKPIINDSLSTFELNYDFIQHQTRRAEKGRFTWIIIAFLCAPLCYYLAKIKNMTWPIMWAIFGFLLSIIPVIILLIIPKRKIKTSYPNPPAP